jgi:hypothetical protein
MTKGGDSIEWKKGIPIFDINKCYWYATVKDDIDVNEFPEDDINEKDINTKAYLGSFKHESQHEYLFTHGYMSKKDTIDIQKNVFAVTDCSDRNRKLLLGGKRKTNRNRKNKKLKRTRRKKVRIHNN